MVTVRSPSDGPESKQGSRQRPAGSLDSDAVVAMGAAAELAGVVRSRVSERLKTKGNYQEVEKGVASPPKVFFRPEEVLVGTAMRGGGILPDEIQNRSV